MRTFVHHDGALGDVLLSLPGLFAIRRISKHLHFAGRADIGFLVREFGLADEVSPAGSSRYASLYGGGADEALSRFLRSFDRACLFTVDPASAMAVALLAVVPEAKVIGTIPSGADAVHVSDFRLMQLQEVTVLAEAPILPVQRQMLDLAGLMLGRWGYDGYRPLVAVHPGSGSAVKSWPLERFFEVIVRLKAAADPFVLLLTGPAEEAALKARVEAFSRGCAGVAHMSDADLVSVAAILRRSDLFIGNDSGIGHLAAAAGCAVIALFGPTDPLRWAPRGRRIEVVKDGKLADIGPTEVYSRALVMLRDGRP